MSVSMTVILECGRVPDGVVPADQQSFGQNLILYLGKLAEIADGLGGARARRLRPGSAAVLGRRPPCRRLAAP
jgi:hypothetical protein